MADTKKHDHLDLAFINLQRAIQPHHFCPVKEYNSNQTNPPRMKKQKENYDVETVTVDLNDVESMCVYVHTQRLPAIPNTSGEEGLQDIPARDGMVLVEFPVDSKGRVVFGSRADAAMCFKNMAEELK